jgi:putative membrane protein
VNKIKHYLVLLLKGAGMGAANVIPGVSGGTVALITNIFEELIDSIKSFDIGAAKLLFSGKLKAFAKYVNLWFLIAVFGGAILSVFSLAVLLEYLFEKSELQVYAFFFGLILASVYFVARTVNNWNIASVISFIVGSAIAIYISFMEPASGNDSIPYLLICGVVAICSMILPGLSGSYVLLLMGNYKLVMIDAVAEVNLKILAPVAIGAVIGLVAFSHLLSWVYKRFRDNTIAILSGFILGSLFILWPWKNPVYKLDAMGQPLVKSGGEMIIQGYERFIPTELNSQVLLSIGLILAGILVIWAMEKIAGEAPEKK